MKVESVDERTARWEVNFPAYRVYFFHNPWGEGYGWATYTYELREAHNVQQVLAWADANARGRPYCVYAVVDRGGGEGSGVGLLQLCGWDPNAPASPRLEPPADLTSPVTIADAASVDAERAAARERALERRPTEP